VEIAWLTLFGLLLGRHYRDAEGEGLVASREEGLQDALTIDHNVRFEIRKGAKARCQDFKAQCLAFDELLFQLRVFTLFASRLFSVMRRSIVDRSWKTAA
jgi:hypothetical protein